MNKKEVIQAMANGEPIDLDILIQGKFRIGTISIDALALMKSLQVLLDSGEIKMFETSSFEEIAIEKLRSTPLDEDEIAMFQSQLQLQGGGRVSKAKLKKSGSAFYQTATLDQLRKRLTQKNRRWIFLSMIKDFENQFATALLTIQSIAQQRAENEIRKELGMPQLKAPEMERFVRDAWKEPLKRHLVIKQGGKRKRSGFEWTPEVEVLLFKTVEGLPTINGEPLWKYMRKSLVQFDFDQNEVARLKSLQQFQSVIDLFEEAVQNWRTHANHRSLSYLPAMHFSFLHALRIMKMEPSGGYHALRSRYYKGRKLAST